MVNILSPAGSMEAVYAAIASGADEVYFGGGDYNARQYAKNFSKAELAVAIALCHKHGVKALITLNTLLGDRELPAAIKFAKEVALMGADALIVADLGLITALTELVPSIELHASTQLSVHSLDGAEVAYKLGAQRVVLARELNFKNIEYITKNTKAETEVFVHGALCYCYSGQCLMSSVIGRRSGNRGRCAGPCRLPYTVEGKKGYHLSLKDLYLADRVKELEDMGVAALKIEGRMKRPEYVSAVTSVYASAKKGKKPTQKEKDRLAQIFSRSGFTDCFYTGQLSSQNLGKKEEGDTNSYERLLSAERAKYISLKNEKISPFLPEVEESFGTDILNRVKDLKSKAGATDLICFYCFAEQAGAENESVSTIFLPLEEVLKGVNTKAEVGIHFPKVLTDDELENFEAKLKKAKAMGINLVCIENIGQIELAKRHGFNFICGISFNAFNSLSVKALYDMGAKTVISSVECSGPQLRDIAKHQNVAIFGYGRIPLMITESCLMRNAKNCDKKSCKLPVSLTDRMGEKFVVMKQPHCRNTIYNSKPLWFADRLKNIKQMGISTLALFFSDESNKQCKSVIEAYTKKQEYKPKDITRGFLDKKVL